MQYSNGYGHLIISCVIVGCLTTLLVFKAIDTTTFVSVGSPVIAFWFLTGAANRFNTQNPTVDTHSTTPPANTTTTSGSF